MSASAIESGRRSTQPQATNVVRSDGTVNLRAYVDFAKKAGLNFHGESLGRVFIRRGRAKGEFTINLPDVPKGTRITVGLVDQEGTTGLRLSAKTPQVTQKVGARNNLTVSVESVESSDVRGVLLLGVDGQGQPAYRYGVWPLPKGKAPDIQSGFDAGKDNSWRAFSSQDGF